MQFLLIIYSNYIFLLTSCMIYSNIYLKERKRDNDKTDEHAHQLKQFNAQKKMIVLLFFGLRNNKNHLILHNSH